MNLNRCCYLDVGWVGGQFLRFLLLRKEAENVLLFLSRKPEERSGWSTIDGVKTVKRKWLAFLLLIGHGTRSLDPIVTQSEGSQMAKSPEEQAAAMIQNLEEKTGKSLPEWIKIAASTKLEKHGQIVKYLKTEHGMTHGYANLVAHKTLESDAGSSNESDLIAAQYAGPKEPLRAIYDVLMTATVQLGKDVEISPKKAYVSLRRKKQFAIIQPSTRTRVDLGLNLKGVEPEGRLELSGSFNSMVSHRVRLSEAKDVDSAVKKWLKAAYDAS